MTILEKRQEVQELTLEEVMGDRFGRYSKYIIQERAHLEYLVGPVLE